MKQKSLIAYFVILVILCAGIIIGGLLWFAWHVPLQFMIPRTVEIPLLTSILNHLILAVGSVCSFTYLAYVYIESDSIFVTSIAHIAMNNAAAALSYFVIIQNQTLANLGLTLTMLIVVAIMVFQKVLVFDGLSSSKAIL